MSSHWAMVTAKMTRICQRYSLHSVGCRWSTRPPCGNRLSAMRQRRNCRQSNISALAGVSTGGMASVRSPLNTRWRSSASRSPTTPKRIMSPPTAPCPREVSAAPYIGAVEAWETRSSTSRAMIARPRSVAGVVDEDHHRVLGAGGRSAGAARRGGVRRAIRPAFAGQSAATRERANSVSARSGAEAPASNTTRSVSGCRASATSTVRWPSRTNVTPVASGGGWRRRSRWRPTSP